MKSRAFVRRMAACALGLSGVMCGVLISVEHAAAQTKIDELQPATQDPKARAILDAAKAKLSTIRAMTADVESSRDPTRDFDRDGEVFLERPNKFRIESLGGAAVEVRRLVAVSDGQTVTRYNETDFVAYQQPVRRENFYMGQNFLVQFFFNPGPIRFDPADSLWGRAVSLFDTNLSAYNKDTRLILLGERVLEGGKYHVIEIKYNTPRNDIRQQVYVGVDDQLIYQVDTYFDGDIFSQKFRNIRVSNTLPARTWLQKKAEKMPLVATDPVRMGAEAPDFTLPAHDGKEINMKKLLQGKKGMYLCTFNGEAGRWKGNADEHLPQMRILQEMKDRYEKQGLVVVALVGGPGITPDLRHEMMLNWMPDVSRFNYPIIIDVDVERGIQGSAYQNFNLGGRNNILLDSRGRVVFAARNFSSVNQLAFYQALAQIGFSVSAADLERAAK